MTIASRQFFLSRWEALAAAGLLLVYIFLAVSATTEESNTFDEAGHLTTGYLYWTHPEVPISPSTGYLAQAWGGLPLLFDSISLRQTQPDPPANMMEWLQGYRLFFLMGNDPAKLLLQGRTMIALLGAALGTLVFCWSRELFGAQGGLLSLLLFVFNPTMLSNGALVTADMAAALGFTVATYGFWKLTHLVTWRTLLFSVLALCVLVISKMSAFVIGPIFFLILLVRFFSPRPVVCRLGVKAEWNDRRQRVAAWCVLLLVHLAGVIALLWLTYDYKYSDDGGAVERVDALIASPTNLTSTLISTLDSLHILPTTYVRGLGVILITSPQGGFVCGTYYPNGVWWFYPFAFLVKTPISTLLLLVFSCVAYAQWKSPPAKKKALPQPTPRPGLDDLAPLLILGGIYALACITSSFNIGIRHMMTLYPVLFILAGANVYWLRSSQPLVRIGLGVLLLGTALESCSVYPHYLAFFNQLVGGPRYGYRYLVDSSLDWGQDLPGLKKWLDKNAPDGGPDNVYCSYFGTGDPAYYGINVRPLPGRFGLQSAKTYPLEKGIYCISATSLQGAAAWTFNEENLYQQVRAELVRWEATAGNPTARQNLLQEKGSAYWNSYLQANATLQFSRLCACLRQREPDDEVGYSILIYRVSDDALQQALYGSPPIAPLL